MQVFEKTCRIGSIEPCSSRQLECIPLNHTFFLRDREMSENEEAGGHVGSENGPKPPQRSARDQGSVLAERFDNMAHSLD